MRKTLAFIAFFLLSIAYVTAQTRAINGKVTDENGAAIDGASIIIKGTSTGTAAKPDGSFTLSAKTGDVLVISAVNFGSAEVTVGSKETYNVTLQRAANVINEVVVTALGIRRTKNQLPYAAQQVGGEEIARTRTNNVASSLSGKVSGLEIRQSNSLGGSTNVVIRGVKSLTGNNQALFVIDGVPFDNSNVNTANQRSGRGGYDYGNAASDINPDNIESITVLKGAAATALYGSRGANGVIMITSKKARRGLGITVNSGVIVGKVDKKTFASYQKQYGGGYGRYYEDTSGYFFWRDPNQGFGAAYVTDADGNIIEWLPSGAFVAPMQDDASYGAPFNPNQMVYQWDAFFDSSSPNFGKPRPWVAAANDPTQFFETQLSFNNSVFIDGASDKGSFNLGYTRTTDNGILPISKITKDLVNFSSAYNITPKLTASASINYSKIKGLGRYGTGYDTKNPMQGFRQWWEMNVDVKELKDAYLRSDTWGLPEKKNVTWNWTDPTLLAPIYWNNPYWDRYENYENDERSRYMGYVSLSYKITNWLNILGRVGVDFYNELREERVAVGSIAMSILGEDFERRVNLQATEDWTEPLRKPIMIF